MLVQVLHNALAQLVEEYGIDRELLFGRREVIHVLKIEDWMESVMNAENMELRPWGSYLLFILVSSYTPYNPLQEAHPGKVPKVFSFSISLSRLTKIGDEGKE